MALFNNSNSNTSTGSSALSSSNTTSESTTGTAGATIEGESTLEPEIPRLYINSHDQDEDNKPEVAEEAVVNGENEDEHYEDNRDRNNLRPFSSSSSSLTLSALSKTPFFNNNSGGNFSVDDESLRIPREPAYGDDNADGDDDGNEEDIEDGDEYDDDDDLYDQLFDLHDPISRKAALATASALFAQSHQQQQQHQHQLSLHYQSTLRRSNSTTSNKSIGAEDMDEVERSFLRCTKPICSKKQLISCLSSRSTSPGPISPLLSDEDFGCISTATSSTSTSVSSSSTTNDGSVPPSLCSNSSTAPSSRRSSDGSHTPRVRFKKGCVITAVNLTWAPTTYDRAPIDVAESLDMHRCKNVEDAEGYAQDDEIVIHCDDEQPHYLNEEQQQHTRGEWQAFAPGIYNASDLPVDLLPRAAPTSSSASSPSSAAATAMRMLSPPEDSPSSASDCQTSGFSFSRSTVGYPLSRQCFERSLSSSSSSSSSESENEDVIERCRGLRDLHHQLSSGSAALKVPSPSIYRPTARSPIRHSSIVSSTATVETSLGAAARELSDSLDESSRSSSPSLSRTASDDCLSSTPRAGNGSTFMSRRSAAAGQVGDQQHYFASSIPSCVAARQANFDANGTHDTSPPPPEEQPARKVQRRLERRSSSACSVSRFPVSSDIWESCEALGGF